MQCSADGVLGVRRRCDVSCDSVAVTGSSVGQLAVRLSKSRPHSDRKGVRSGRGPDRSTADARRVGWVGQLTRSPEK